MACELERPAAAAKAPHGGVRGPQHSPRTRHMLRADWPRAVVIMYAYVWRCIRIHTCEEEFTYLFAYILDAQEVLRHDGIMVFARPGVGHVSDAPFDAYAKLAQSCSLTALGTPSLRNQEHIAENRYVVWRFDKMTKRGLYPQRRRSRPIGKIIAVDQLEMFRILVFLPFGLDHLRLCSC